LSLNSFSLGTFLLVLILALFQFKIYIDIKETKAEIEYIKTNYTPLTLSKQRANYVNTYLEEIAMGIANSTSIANTAMDAVYNDSSKFWYVGLTTDQIDSIRLNCEPSKYWNASQIVKSQVLNLYDSIY